MEIVISCRSVRKNVMNSSPQINGRISMMDNFTTHMPPQGKGLASGRRNEGAETDAYPRVEVGKNRPKIKPRGNSQDFKCDTWSV